MKAAYVFGFIAALGIALASCGRHQAPDELFREAVMDPIPASVQVLNASKESRKGDIFVWIHFKISPGDFGGFFKSGAFENMYSTDLDFSAYRPPNWRVAARLGPNVGHFVGRADPHYGRDWTVKDMLVNAKDDEVLFLMRSCYNY